MMIGDRGTGNLQTTLDNLNVVYSAEKRQYLQLGGAAIAALTAAYFMRSKWLVLGGLILLAVFVKKFTGAQTLLAKRDAAQADFLAASVVKG